MFNVNDDLSIYATRGDVVFFAVTADDDGVPHLFQAGDLVRMKVYGKKNAENVVLQADFPVTEETESVEIFLTEDDTKIGEVISKPVDYWYEIELNPESIPRTIVGYDEDGPKIFKLFPEGADIETYVPDPDDFPVVDDELDMTSPRPIQNQAVAREIVNLTAAVDSVLDKVYPVGSVYISMSATDPAILFGGTWERLTNRFLLGSGSQYPAGTTGGASKVTLTASELPAHSHSVYDTNMPTVDLGVEWRDFGTPSAAHRDYGFTINGTLKTREEGGGQAHDNMPPYLVVNMWKRTA